MRCGRAASGCPTARSSRSGGGLRGSTCRRGASFGPAGRSTATCSTSASPPAGSRGTKSRSSPKRSATRFRGGSRWRRRWRRGAGRRALELAVFREVRDVGDEGVIAPLLNSFSSQEFAADYGDYYRADGARLTYRHGSGVRSEWSAALGRETIHSLAVTAQPASGRFRPNPAVGDVGLALAQLAVRRRSEGFAVRRDVHYELVAEAGRADDGTGYLRLSGAGHVLLPAGATRLLVRAQGGAATRDLPAHRSFVLGRRGTLLGDGFRSWGGGRMALAHVEWRVAVPFF